jgi:hypothetical protein
MRNGPYSIRTSPFLLLQFETACIRGVLENRRAALRYGLDMNDVQQAFGVFQNAPASCYRFSESLILLEQESDQENL